MPSMKSGVSDCRARRCTLHDRRDQINGRACMRCMRCQREQCPHHDDSACRGECDHCLPLRPGRGARRHCLGAVHADVSGRPGRARCEPDQHRAHRIDQRRCRLRPAACERGLSSAGDRPARAVQSRTQAGDRHGCRSRRPSPIRDIQVLSADAGRVRARSAEAIDYTQTPSWRQCRAIAATGGRERKGRRLASAMASAYDVAVGSTDNVRSHGWRDCRKLASQRTCDWA